MPAGAIVSTELLRPQGEAERVSGDGFRTGLYANTTTPVPDALFSALGVSRTRTPTIGERMFAGCILANQLRFRSPRQSYKAQVRG